MNNTIKTHVVGVDIGVKNTTVAIVDIRGTIIAQERFATADDPNISSYATALTEHIIALAESSVGFENIRSVGISAPSGNFVTGSIENAANMPWKGVIPLSAMMRDQLGLSVALANDAHVTALGENVYGSAHGMRDFIVISLGHGGVGSCIFSNGQPHLGTSGSAGEFGHTCVDDGGRQCNCGRRGCLEAYTSDRGVALTAQELIAAASEPTLLSDLAELSPMAIGECVDKGDKLAKEVYRKTGFWLGMALANYASVVNPEAIILTGELTEAGKWLMPPTLESFEEHVFPNIRGKVKIVISDIPNAERDVLGASALAWTVKEYSLFK